MNSNTFESVGWFRQFHLVELYPEIDIIRNSLGISVWLALLEMSEEAVTQLAHCAYKHDCIQCYRMSCDPNCEGEQWSNEPGRNEAKANYVTWMCQFNEGASENIANRINCSARISDPKYLFAIHELSLCVCVYVCVVSSWALSRNQTVNFSSQ